MAHKYIWMGSLALALRQALGSSYQISADLFYMRPSLRHAYGQGSFIKIALATSAMEPPGRLFALSKASAATLAAKRRRSRASGKTPRAGRHQKDQRLRRCEQPS